MPGSQAIEAVCIGMSVVDVLAKGVERIQFGGATTFVESVGVSAGGDAMNEALTLAHLGHKVGLMTLVGDDHQGRILIEECRRAGVDVGAVARSENYPTSTSVVLIGKDGERSFISQKGGTVDEFSLADIHLDRIKPGIKVVSIGSLFCSRRFDEEALLPVLRKAKQVGAVTVADFVPNRADAKLESLVEAFAFLDYVMPSQEEAFLYTGAGEIEAAARAFLDCGAKNVVIKLGKNGALARGPGGAFAVPAYPAKAVDTTGAGDNFVAGFISGLLRGFSLDDCLRLAAATAAISVASVGATTGVTSYEQVHALMNSK